MIEEEHKALTLIALEKAPIHKVNSGEMNGYNEGYRCEGNETLLAIVAILLTFVSAHKSLSMTSRFVREPLAASLEIFQTALLLTLLLLP